MKRHGVKWVDPGLPVTDDGDRDRPDTDGQCNEGSSRSKEATTMDGRLTAGYVGFHHGQIQSSLGTVIRTSKPNWQQFARR